MLTRTPLAAYQFDDEGGKHIRLFYQEPSGDIKVLFYDPVVGWNPRSEQETLVGRAKLNSGIVVVGWKKGTQQRAYYLDNNSQIVEKVYIGGPGLKWNSGGIHNLQAAPYSRLAGIVYGEVSRIHIFYQDPTNKLREHVYKGGWKDGSKNLPVAFAGTSIAAGTNDPSPNNLHGWLYYQATDLKIREVWNNGTDWITGAFNATRVYPPGAAISVAAWASPIKVRVAVLDEGNNICVTAWDPHVGWKPSAEIGFKAITGSDIAIINAAGSSQPEDALRIYYQPESGDVAEGYSQDGNAWQLGPQNLEKESKGPDPLPLVPEPDIKPIPIAPGPVVCHYRHVKEILLVCWNLFAIVALAVLFARTGKN